MGVRTVVCVLKSGGIYTPEWVSKLASGVARNLAEPARFVCLTDMENVQCETIQLVNGWPGWWSKLEALRPGLFDGPVLYLDLDSVIIGSLDDMFAELGEFRMVKMWGKRAGRFCSTTMSWGRDMSAIYDWFLAAPETIMKRYDEERPGGRIGDQAAIEDSCGELGIDISSWPGLQVASYKDHCLVMPPAEANVVSYHGRPKPPDAKDGWTAKAWQ